MSLVLGAIASIPVKPLLERLHQRNEYLIGSHHLLRKTLIQQTGSHASIKAQFLNGFYDRVQLSPGMGWAPRA